MLRTTNGFPSYTDANLLTKANYILAQMTDNDNFTTPVPSLADVTALVTEYEDALSGAATRSVQAVTHKNTKKAELVSTLRNLGNYVTAVANGNIDILVSSGYDITKPSTPVPPLVTPEAPLMSLGANAGSLKISVKRQKGAVTNQFLLTDDLSAPPSQWITMFSSKINLEFTNLKSATRYYSKAIQIGRGQQWVESPISTFVTQ